jgi:hypothetical protein
VTTKENVINSDWLARIGLQFNPFADTLWDAAQDTRLSRYFVLPDAFAAIWGDWSSYVLAPLGGGKTAMSVHTARTCWVGQETNRPFPLPYTPAYGRLRHTHPTSDDHLTALSENAAQHLLLALAYRPHWFLEADPVVQLRIHHALDWNLAPRPLHHYLKVLRQNYQLTALTRLLKPTYEIVDLPDHTNLQALVGILSDTPTATPPSTAGERWQNIVDIILHDLKFRALYILIDKIDAIGRTANNPEQAIDSIAYLLERIEDWEQQDIYLKGFFPLDSRTALLSHYPKATQHDRIVTITWSPEKLATLVKKRLYIASSGSFDSFDAKAAPSIEQNIELTLAREIQQLPREMIALCNQILKVFYTQENSEYLTAELLNIALTKYHHSVPPGLMAAH